MSRGCGLFSGVFKCSVAGDPFTLSFSLWLKEGRLTVGVLARLPFESDKLCFLFTICQGIILVFTPTNTDDFGNVFPPFYQHWTISPRTAAIGYLHFLVSVLILNIAVLKSEHDLKVTSKCVFQTPVKGTFWFYQMSCVKNTGFPSCFKWIWIFNTK